MPNVALKKRGGREGSLLFYTSGRGGEGGGKKKKGVFPPLDDGRASRMMIPSRR